MLMLMLSLLVGLIQKKRHVDPAASLGLVMMYHGHSPWHMDVVHDSLVPNAWSNLPCVDSIPRMLEEQRLVGHSLWVDVPACHARAESVLGGIHTLQQHQTDPKSHVHTTHPPREYPIRQLDVHEWENWNGVESPPIAIARDIGWIDLLSAILADPYRGQHEIECHANVHPKWIKNGFSATVVATLDSFACNFILVMRGRLHPMGRTPKRTGKCGQPF
eukprot:Nitzschia sp. Nitz4//scaffold133_size116822//87734//88478//NITZ4_003817-RA/size116822-exonerate_est2genome-gene-0.126-mRNA-1//1//CDS//3329535426//2737//frame0